MATTVCFEIQCDAAMLVECSDGKWRILAQVADPSPYKGNPLVAFIEGDDWKLVDPNWKTKEGVSRAPYFGHPLDRSVSADIIKPIEDPMKEIVK
jgi:hypothetical protein